MKAAVWLLICLAVVTITQAGHHQHDRQDNRDDRRHDRRHDSRENNLQSRSQENLQYSKENNKQDKWQDYRQNTKDNRRHDTKENDDEQDRSQNNRRDSRENNKQDERQDNRQDWTGSNDDRQDRRQDNREQNVDDRRQESKENNERREESRENNRYDNRRDSRQNGRNDDRQSNRHDGGQDRRQHSKEKNVEDRRQDSRENNKQEERQNSWQQNRQPWRDIVIENRGKIVNNGIQRDGQQRYTQKQELLNQLGYTQTIDRIASTAMDMETLRKQKFLLSLVLTVNDAQNEVELEELGQTLILDHEKYVDSLDDDMRHLVQLCITGQMLRKTDNFYGFNPEHLRQLHGLYKLLVRTRDWDTFQRNACFARLHLNRVLFVNALLLAVKEHPETRQLILPAMNEILPELFYDKQLLQNSRNLNLADLVTKRATVKPELMDEMRRSWGGQGPERNTNIGHQRWGGMQPQKTWQEWRQEKLDRQAGRGPTQTVQNDVQKLVLATVMAGNTRSENLDKRISYLTQDVGLSNYWYSLTMDCLREMRLPTTERKGIEDGRSLTTDNQRNEDQETTNDLSNNRLLHTNRRRWKQKQDQTTVELGDVIQHELITKQKINSDTEQREKLERERQRDDIQRINGKGTQRIDSRQDPANKDDSRLKADQGGRIVEALLGVLRDGRTKIVNASKSKTIQEAQSSNVNKEDVRLLKVDRRRLNKNLDSQEQRQSREDSEEKDNLSHRDFNEQLGQVRDEKILLIRDDKIDGNRLLKSNRQKLNQQDFVENTRIDRDQRSMEEKSSGDNGNNSIGNKRLLKVNRRRLNTSSTLRSDVNKQKLNQRLRDLKDSREERRQDSEESRRQDTEERRRQDFNENMEKKRLIKVHLANMFGNNLDDLKRAQTLRKHQDSSEKSEQDSSERRRDSDEQRRQGLRTQKRPASDEQRRQDSSEEIGMQNRISIDGDRILRVNRRRLNIRNRLRSNLDDLNIAEENGKLHDSSEVRRDSYEKIEHHSGEQSRQVLDEQRRQGSDEETGTLQKSSINVDRILRVNRRRSNTRNRLESNLDDLNRDQEKRKLQDSSEKRRENTDEQRRQGSAEQNRQVSDEQRTQDLNEQIGMQQRNSIDGNRLLRVNRRLLNRRNMLETNQNTLNIAQEKRELQDSSEERRQDSSEERLRVSDEQRKNNSDEEIDTLDKNSIDEERLLRVNRRRLSQNSRQTNKNGNKSIWPQENLDNQQMAQRREDNNQNSDENTQQNLDESNGMLRNFGKILSKVIRQKVTQRSQESSSKEDSDERSNTKNQQKSSEQSSEESREEIKRPATHARLLAVGRRRLPRNVDSQLGEKIKLSALRTGEMKIANMQQILARLRMERLSHQLENVLASKQKLSDDDSRKLKSSDIQQKTHDHRQLLMQIQNMEQILKIIIDEELQLLSSKNEINLKQSNLLELIGRIFMNRVSNSDLDVFQVWSHLMQTSADLSNSLMFNAAQQLREPAFSYLMESILNIVNIYSEKLPSYDSQRLGLDDVQLKDVKVDKLQTYFDTTDADLINTLDQQTLRQQNIELKNILSTPVARQQRLNHKSFSIKLDINAKREHRVVVRTFLGPKFDENGNEMSFTDNRRNFMLLDAFTSDLLPGQNSIKRKSSDISWTSRDSTPLNQIYREVMQAIDGTQNLQLDRLIGNNQRFPHRLLLPRGLPQGLPMQLFIILTQQSDSDSLLQQQLQTESAVLGMGTAAIGLDALPLGFPLDRRIDNEQNILVPNSILKDIFIYHDDKIDI